MLNIYKDIHYIYYVYIRIGVKSMRKAICLTLEETQIKEIDEARGDVPRSRFIGRILQERQP